MADLDATHSPEIEALALEGRKSNAGVAKDYMQGTEAGRGLLTQSGPSQSLAFGSPMQAAIKSRYMGEYNFEKQKLEHKVLRSASEDNIRNLAATSQMANEEVEQNRQKMMLKNEVEQANKRARGQVLGTVLGITGGLAGAYVGYGAGGAGAKAGAAAGAGAGMQLGSGLGQAFGGT
jgi:hypothetical protein